MEKFKRCSPSPLRITTHVASATINAKLNLKLLAENLDISKDVLYIEFKTEKENIIKGKKGGKTSKKSSKGRFWNQITILFQPEAGFQNNIKIFNNGSISMTGIKKIENGKRSIEILVEKIKEIYKEKEIKDIIEDNTPIDELQLKTFSIALINSDYMISYNINRTRLHKLLCNQYHIFSTFDACEYPGVNIKMFWNENTKNTEKNGICMCKSKCNGKGDGKGDGKCKVVTIFAFQSGSIMITGARTIEQIYAGYNFINNVFEKHKDILEMKIPDFLKKDVVVKEKRKPNVYILKKNIVNEDLFKAMMKHQEKT